MNLRRTFSLLPLVLAGQMYAANLPLEFSGVLTDGEKTRFALTDKTNNQTTWLELGGEINGYTIARYEPKSETVTLQKGVEEHPLRLIVAKTPDASEVAASAANASAPSTDATAVAIKNNLRQLAVAARQFQLETGATSATFADLVGPDKYVKQLAPVDGENYSGLTFGPGASNLSVTTASGITVAVDTGPTLGTLGHVAADADPAAPASTGSPAPAQANTPSTPPALTPTGPINTSHVVREGDTLAKIAEAAGVSEQELQALNPEVNPSSLKVGQPIRIR